jgi:hypothetical protein
MSLTPPSKAALSKYGLTAEDWLEMAGESHGQCPICGVALQDKVITTERGGKISKMVRSNAHVDHVHVRGFDKMAPAMRRQFVRGLVCQMCNRFYLCQRMTKQKAVNMTVYFDRYEKKQRLI